MDDFELEVTNLRERKATAIAAASSPVNHTDHDDHTPAQSGVRALLGHRLTRPQRLWRTLAVITTILLALALILAINPNTRTALDALLHPATTFSDSAAPGAEQFDFVHVAPWGDLRIDGQTVPKKQVLQRFRAITLAPGAHSLDYSAPPFAPLHCTLTVPADTTSDTCPLSKGNDAPTLYNDTVRELNLRASFTDLSPQQLAALIKASSTGLTAASPTATVAPGEHYLTAGGTFTNTSGLPIRATLLYSLSNSLTDQQTHQLFSLEGFPCQTLCLSPHLLDQTPLEWGIVAHVTLSWSYAVPHSALYGPLTPDLDTMDIAVPLHITWQHGWHVIPLQAMQVIYGGLFGSSPICMPAQEMLNSVPARNSFSSSTYTTTPASGAEGCLIQWREGTGPNTYGPPNYLLYRFGVLLAANDEARHTFPTLPVADSSEQALAQQLATHG